LIKTDLLKEYQVGIQIKDISMFKVKTLATALSIGAMTLCASQAFAQKAGDMIYSIGAAYIKPNASLSPLNSTSSAFNTALVGSSASAKGLSTVTLGGLYMWTDQIATEVTIGIPPKMTTDFTTPAATTIPHPGASTAKELNPSIVAKYLFNSPESEIRPYVGLGITYTTFTNVQANLNDPMIAMMAGTSSSLSSTTGAIFNAGMIYNIDKKWSVNGSLSYVPLKTNVTFVGTDPYAGNAKATTTGVITLNPLDLVIRVGYNF
jgi:outer membrane protein